MYLIIVGARTIRGTRTIRCIYYWIKTIVFCNSWKYS